MVMSRSKATIQPARATASWFVWWEGSLIGELGLLDGVARSADCIALTDLQVGVLYRSDFVRLLEEDPRLGNRLLLAIATRTAARLREITTKFRLFAQMNKVMSAELAADAHAVQRRYATSSLAPVPGASNDFFASRADRLAGAVLSGWDLVSGRDAQLVQSITYQFQAQQGGSRALAVVVC